ncbi:MAG: hypothetical protein CMA15_04170, partial [Euryarchaeota archaeon]|nr:hypothetical protein [Euryarchaeota archaeon]
FRSLYHTGTVFDSYVGSRKSPIPLGTVFIGRDKSELETSLGYVSFMSFLEGTQFTDMRTTRFLRDGIE